MEEQKAIGRTKPDSIELDPKPASAHAAQTDQDEVGKIVRRNLAYYFLPSLDDLLALGA